MSIITNQEYMRHLLSQPHQFTARPNRMVQLSGSTTGKHIRCCLFEDGRIHTAISRESVKDAVDIMRAWQQGQEFPEGIHEIT